MWLFLLGASAESNRQAAAALVERYPALQIVGREDGYFQDSEAIVRKINASDAELLFVAMGSPKQELWIAQHRDAIEAPFCMGVGGTFDVAAGTARRAPIIFQKTGTEFLFQLVTRPGWSLATRWRRIGARLLFLLAAAEGMKATWTILATTQACRMKTPADRLSSATARRQGP